VGTGNTLSPDAPGFGVRMMGLIGGKVNCHRNSKMKKQLSLFLIISMFIVSYVCQYPFKFYILVWHYEFEYKQNNFTKSEARVSCLYWAGYRKVEIDLISLNSALGKHRKTCPISIIFAPRAYMIG
jgi:hypothetical protein